MALTRYSRDAQHFVAAIAFEWDGRRYDTGEPFPALELGLSEWRRRQLWVANKIAVADGPPPVAQPVDPEPAREVDPPPPAAIAAPPAKKQRARAGA